MARRLDPKLQRIIEDASRDAQSSYTPLPSSIPDDFTHTPFDRHLERRQSMREPRFLAAGFQSAHAALNEFGRYYSFLIRSISLTSLFS
jgi:hypothetical protein